MTTALRTPMPTVAASPRPQPSRASDACIAAFDLSKASLRMALAAQLPEAAAMHYATAAAAGRLARSLSGTTT